MIPSMIIIKPIMTIYFPAIGFIISGALAIFIIHIIPNVMTPVPIAIRLLIHNPISNNPNMVISINAVCFAITAHANITHEMMIYLSESQ